MSDNTEPHIFRCTLNFSTDAKTWITVVSYDGSIVHRIEATPELLGMFDQGNSRVYCDGHYDLDDNMVWLGKQLEGLTW